VGVCSATRHERCQGRGGGHHCRLRRHGSASGDCFGAATAGLVANASGLDNGLDPGSVLRASLWGPLALVAAPLAACAIGVRLNLMSRALPSKD
jgi:hypothetical protein